MSMQDSPKKGPRAVVHKQILDTAESNPDASIEAIADEISGASPDLVERVFEDYGDPADEQAPTADTTSSTATAASDGGQLQSSDNFDQQLTSLHDRIDQLEQRIEDMTVTDGNPFSDPDLAAKVVRACVNDDQITDDEEIAILSELLE